EPDDRVARDRVTALREPDEEVADALDPDATGPFLRLRRGDSRQADLRVVEDAESHDDLLGADRAVADRGVEVVERLVVVLPADLGDLVLADDLEALPGEPSELALERVAAVDDVLVAVLALEPLADLFPGVGGPDDVHPVARRAVLALRRDDLDDVAVLQAVVERDEPVVDLRPDRPVTDIGVDPVGEVERGRAGRQVLDVALWGEHEDLVLEDVELDALDELRRVADVALPVHQLAEPGQLRVVLAVALRAFLVAPVGGDADLADLVHRLGPDLDLEGLAVERDHRRVERLVEVVLGDRDVVVELARDRPPQGVDDAERRVAVADVVDEDPDRVDVVDLGELGGLALHLLVDAVDVLGPALEVGLDARLLQPRRQLGDR